MERRNCALFDAEAEKLIFDTTWNHEQIDEYIRKVVFPVPFGFIDENTKKGKQKYKCEWILINKEKRRYEVVPITEPTGADLARYRGRQKCSTSINFIALRPKIPSNVFKSWDPDYDGLFQVAGLDVGGDDDDSIEDSNDDEYSRPAHTSRDLTLKRIRDTVSFIELSSEDDNDEPAVKKMKISCKLEGSVKAEQEDVDLISQQAEQPLFLLSPEVDDLPANLDRMSLSPEHHRKSGNTREAAKNPLFSTPTRNGSTSRNTMLGVPPSQFHFSAFKKDSITKPPKRVAPPADFIRPSFDDRMLRHVPDPESPSSAPRINPWSRDYFLGDIY